jgi:integrase
MEAAPSLDQAVRKYLDWCGKHRSPRSLEWYKGHLHGFLAHLGGSSRMPLADLKPYHVVDWVDGHGRWGDTYKRGAIVAVQRVCNWAEQMGYVEAAPLTKVTKPPAGRRDNPMSPDDYQALLALLAEGDPFRDLLAFVWHSGCRPQEARHVEPRHVDLARERVVIPREEAQGERIP